MTGISELRRALISRILEEDASTPRTLRHAAFENVRLTEPLNSLVEKVAKHADRVSDDDFAAAKAAGYTEEQLFELVVCAAVGEATRQYENALAALDAAIQRGGNASENSR